MNTTSWNSRVAIPSRHLSILSHLSRHMELFKLPKSRGNMLNHVESKLINQGRSVDSPSSSGFSMFMETKATSEAIWCRCDVKINKNETVFYLYWGIMRNKNMKRTEEISLQCCASHYLVVLGSLMFIVNSGCASAWFQEKLKRRTWWDAWICEITGSILLNECTNLNKLVVVHNILFLAHCCRRSSISDAPTAKRRKRGHGCCHLPPTKLFFVTPTGCQTFWLSMASLTSMNLAPPATAGFGSSAKRKRCRDRSLSGWKVWLFMFSAPQEIFLNHCSI